MADRLNAAAYGVAEELAPGESRIVHGKNRMGEIIKTIEIIRTDRPYVYDLCDAYNAAAPRGLRWDVSHTGELKIASAVKIGGAT